MTPIAPFFNLGAMANVSEALGNFTNVVREVPQGIVQIMQGNAALITDYISDQLYSGKDGFERDLSPSYLDDPYFDKFKNPRAAAVAYRNWKLQITPPGRSFIGLEPRGANTPNLYINGYYHSRITAVGIANGLRIGNSAGFADEVEAKYGSDIYRVGPTARQHFLDNYIRAYLAQMLNPRGR